MLTAQLESASIARKSLSVLEKTHPTISVPLLERIPQLSVASICAAGRHLREQTQSLEVVCNDVRWRKAESEKC
jgi:hypothetical protein